MWSDLYSSSLPFVCDRQPSWTCKWQAYSLLIPRSHRLGFYGLSNGTQSITCAVATRRSIGCAVCRTFAISDVCRSPASFESAVSSRRTAAQWISTCARWTVKRYRRSRSAWKHLEGKCEGGICFRTTAARFSNWPSDSVVDSKHDYCWDWRHGRSRCYANERKCETGGVLSMERCSEKWSDSSAESFEQRIRWFPNLWLQANLLVTSKPRLWFFEARLVWLFRYSSWLVFKRRVDALMFICCCQGKSGFAWILRTRNVGKSHFQRKFSSVHPWWFQVSVPRSRFYAWPTSNFWRNSSATWYMFSHVSIFGVKCLSSAAPLCAAWCAVILSLSQRPSGYCAFFTNLASKANHALPVRLLVVLIFNIFCRNLLIK